MKRIAVLAALLIIAPLVAVNASAPGGRVACTVGSDIDGWLLMHRCSGGPAGEPESCPRSAYCTSSHLDSRRYVDVPLRIDTLVDGQRDSTLMRPLLLTTTDSLVVFFDYGSSVLRAVDRRGRDRWRAGRRGQGPGEWGNPTALVGAPDHVLVADGALNRIVRVDATGRVERAVTQSQMPQRLGRASNGQVVAVGGTWGRPAAWFLNDDLKPGRVIPWSGWADSAAGMGAQVRLAGSRHGAIAAVSIFTGRVMPLRANGRFDSGRPAVEPRPIPARVTIDGPGGEPAVSIPPDTKPAIRDAAVVGGTLFVVPAGDAFDGRVVDVYLLPDARYAGSLRVPVELHVLAGDAAGLVAISNDTYPTIVRIGWDPARLQRALSR